LSEVKLTVNSHVTGWKVEKWQMAVFYVRLCIVSPYCCKPDVQLVNMLRGTGFRFFQIGFCIVVKLSLKMSLKSFFYSERPEFCVFLLIRDY